MNLLGRRSVKTLKMFVTRSKIRKLLEADSAEADAAAVENANLKISDDKTLQKDVEDVVSPENTNVESEIFREPAYWRQHLDNIREMRSARNAPVDSMGATACADADGSNPTKRFQILMALMLSSQTKDEVTSSAVKKLKENVGCTPQRLSQTSQEKIAELIYPVGFYKRKAEYIKKVVEILIEKYDGDIPSTYEDLCMLPGVGPKMATLTMNLAWHRTVGIGVDTHVHRIANRLGWTLSATKTPEETAKVVEKWLPKDVWDDVNLLFVGFGQQICTAAKPKCEDCLNQCICPYSMANS